MAANNRKKSKSKKVWRHDPRLDSKINHSMRIHATKSNAARRARKLRAASHPDAPEQKAERVLKAKAAALKMFIAWLDRPEVTAFAALPGQRNIGLTRLVRDFTEEPLPPRDKV